MSTYLSPGVYVEEVPSGSKPIEGVGTAVAAFIGLAAKGPCNTPTLVTNWRQFVEQFGEIMAGSHLGHAVHGYFLNGGGNAYIVRVGVKSEPVPAQAQLHAPTVDDQSRLVPKYEIRAIEAGETGNAVTVEVTDSPGADEGAPTFQLRVSVDDKPVEVFEGLTTGRGRQGAVTLVNQQSQLIRLVEVTNAPATRPANGVAKLGGGALSTVTDLAPSDYVGDVADRTGFGGLETVPEVTMVLVPDAAAALQAGQIDLEGFKAIQLGMIAHCELMGNRVAILDPPPSMNAQQVMDWRTEQAGYDSKFAALYYPWVKVFDPCSGQSTFVPPSGHVAGIWGRNDDTRGVHKAPANEVIRGALDLEVHVSKGEHDLLNPAAVNCLRAFPGRGIRVWGARTLSSDPEWRYLNVRRLFNYLEDSILNGVQWAVFEPNDPALWAKVRRTIASFLTMEWRKGALFGLTPNEAFFVKCDGETNPAEAIDLGQLTCEVGVAPVKPAEFVIFRLSQFSGGASLVAE